MLFRSGPSVAAGRRVLNAAGIPTYDFPDTAARSFALMWKYSDNLRALYETPVAVPDPAGDGQAQARVAARIEEWRAAGRTLLTEVESKELMAACGLPVLATQAARSEEEAVALAVQVGFPVAVKLLSTTQAHKRQAGGVRLDLADAAAVRAAWRDIQASAGEHFAGVSVQRMVRTEGPELIVGSSVDAQFGPVLAEKLGIAHSTIIMEVNVDGPTLRVKRELEGGWFQYLTMPLPSLLTIQIGRAHV